jgi:peptidoglycan/LPS O-acetylase OafA/YrhL
MTRPATAVRAPYPALARRLGYWREYRGRSPAEARLHGVRGLAVLIVIASHTKFAGMAGQGALGVWLFFVLSGYLLSPSFLRPADGVGWRRIGAFYRRRALRLAPAYWLCVCLFYAPWAAAPWQFLAGNLLPFQGWEHLWTIKQEAILYLLLPLVMLPAGLATRRPLLFALGVLAAGVALNALCGLRVLAITGNGGAMQFYPFPFFAGIAAATIQGTPGFAAALRTPAGRIAGDIVTVLFLAGCVATSRQALATTLGITPDGEPLVWMALVATGTACMALVLIAAPGAGPVTRAVFGWPPLQLAGLLAYGLYLVHVWVMAQIGPAGGTLAFLLTLAGSAALALPLYCLVERTFWRPRFAAGANTER